MDSDITERSEQLKQAVIEEFSSLAAMVYYLKESTKGFWVSEEVLIEKYFASGSRVLDVGCGIGRTTLPLAALNYRVTGLDLTPTFIEIAQRLAARVPPEIDYRVGDCTHLEFPDNTFDNALFSYNGWCQIPEEANRAQALREIYRVLRPASPADSTGCGYFIFSTHIRR